MRRVMLTLVGLGMLVFCGSQAAMAGGWNGHGHHGYQGRPAPVYRNNYWRGYPTHYRGGYGRGYGGCAPGYAAAPYGYAYPAPSFGVATRNFSFFLQP